MLSVASRQLLLAVVLCTNPAGFCFAQTPHAGDGSGDAAAAAADNDGGVWQVTYTSPARAHWGGTLVTNASSVTNLQILVSCCTS